MRIFIFIISIILCAACVSRPRATSVGLQADSFQDVALYLKSNQNTSIDDYNKFGPFEYKTTTDHTITLKGEKIFFDVVKPMHQGKSPVVVISHGNYGHKEAHRYQAERIASWGLYAITLQLPKKKQWLKNGERIYSFLHYLNKNLRFIDKRVDRSKVILAGHSFGGSASTIAAGKGAPILGLILLDPAVVHNKVMKYMRRVKVPTILIGADKKRYRSKNRESFFKLIPTEMMETSIVGSTHWDAQYPTMTEMFKFKIGETASREMQERFVSIMVASAVSLSTGQRTKAAWSYIKKLEGQGSVMKNARKLGSKNSKRLIAH